MNALLIGLLAATAAQGAVDSRCEPELVSGKAGEGQTMFHGLSPDGRELAVGWESGSGKSIRRGAFILDLRSGRRTDLPHLNNAPSFSPDGRYLVSASYRDEQGLQTEVVELDRKSGKARSYASSPSTEWLASYSRDGRWILFNSMRTGGSDLYRVERATGKIEQLTNAPSLRSASAIFRPRPPDPVPPQRQGRRLRRRHPRHAHRAEPIRRRNPARGGLSCHQP